MRSSLAGLIAFVALTACGSNGPPLVEEHETTSGQFQGFEIGMNMGQAFSNARNLGATLIAPIPCQHFRVSSENIDELPPLGDSEGVRITDFKGAYVDLYFADQHVLRVASSPSVPFVVPISVGDDVTDAQDKLRGLLRSARDLVVHPIVNHEKQDTLALNESMPTSYMHKCWRFELTGVKPAGATFDLTFDQHGLTRILYRRSRIRAE
jgi:hypothetical protein